MSNNRPTFVRWRILSILVFASFVSYTFRANFSTAAPVMIDDLGLTPIQWGWTMSAFLTGYTIFQIPGGLLGDRFGPRRLVTVIAVLWAAVTALTTLVPSAEFASVGVIMISLMFVRFIAGLAHAPIYPGTNPVVVNWFPVGSWALPCGLSSTGLNLGIAATTPILAWLIIEFGWRISFLLLSPLGLILAGLWWWYGRDTPQEHSAVNEEEIKLIRAGREEQLEAESHSISLLQLLKNRDVFWLTFSYFCIQYTFYVVLTWFFFFLVEVRDFSMTDAGWITSGQWIVGAIGATVGGWYCDKLCKIIGLRWGYRLPLIIGCIACALSLIVGVYHPSQTVAISLFVACLFFNQTVEAPYWAISMAVGGKHSGAVGGAMNTGGNAMGILNAVLVPWTALVFGWSIAISIAAVLSLAAAATILLVRPDQQIEQ